MAAAALEVEEGAGGTEVRLSGDLVIAALPAVEPALGRLAGRRGARAPVVLDLSRIGRLDTAGAWLVVSTMRRLESEGVPVTLAGLTPERAALIETVRSALPEKEVPVAPPGGILGWVAEVGRRTMSILLNFRDLVGFVGLVVARFARLIVSPRRLRITALVHHMEETGLDAVPIVSLLAFLIGVVLAFQGATQLRQFGAEVFVVDLIAISVLRELGILLTAIIVAGRSGSAFAAAIGSMKIREEIDAMRTLGLDPVEVLVVPRVLALLITLPILGFIADIAGLVGGLLMSWIELGVSPAMFITRFWENTDIWHLAVGFIKAPFFAAIVGIVGCFQGFEVSGSAESVGRRTTAAVVLAIFGVIVADALFSVFFAEIGV